MRSSVRYLALLLVAATRLGVAQQEPPTNLRAYQLLAARIGDSLSATIPHGDSSRVLLTVKPEATAWLVQGVIGEALQTGGHKIVVATPANYLADLGILEMHVSYGNPRSDGMFGGKLVDREVRLNMSARLVDQLSGVVTLTKEFSEAFQDTVPVSQVSTLEDATLPATRGSLPGEGFFSSLVEPLVMLGAVAVAVYLLFSVRS